MEIAFTDLNKLLGNADIYLIDQILKGRFEYAMNILDAGCGEGRNLRYFQDRMIIAMDKDPMAIKMARMTYKSIPAECFIEGDVMQIPFPDEVFDFVICSAVLHFATTREEFQKMLLELYRVLKNDGLLFIRTATKLNAPLGEHPLFTYMMDQQDIDWISERFTWLDPFKTVVVEERSMAVLMLCKKGSQ